MPATFENLESLASVRAKINSAIQMTESNKQTLDTVIGQAADIAAAANLAARSQPYDNKDLVEASSQEEFIKTISFVGPDGQTTHQVTNDDTATVYPVTTNGGTKRWVPSNGILDLGMCGTASDLANDFAGIMAQAMVDAQTRSWVLNVPNGSWETQPIRFAAASAGSLNMTFSPSAELIGPANWQHFAGNGVTKNFTLTAWGTASTDTCSAAIVYAGGSYVVLASGDATNGFTKTGTLITLGTAVAAPPVGATLTISSVSSILSITGENGDFSLRVRGGRFYNGNMGYVEQQGSGTCVSLQTLRDVYWDGAPVFRGSATNSFDSGILNKRGDSGLVLGNIERASFYGAKFLYQPDAGNYTTGLARGGAGADNYHIDDGRFVSFFGAHAYHCGLGFRSARDGGGYGLYGCGTDLCFDGFLADNVSSNGMPSARNIVLDGFTCRKTAANVLDLRAMQSVSITNLMIEDWGRMPDGSEPTTSFPMFNLGSGADYMRIDARLRYEEWTPPSYATTLVSMANASFRDTKINLSADLPESAIGVGHTGVYASGAIGSTGIIDLDLNFTNIDNALNVPSNKVVRAKVAHVTRTTGGTTITRYRQHNGLVTPESEGLYGFTDVGLGIGTAAPTQPLHVIGTARVERSGDSSQALLVVSDVLNTLSSRSSPGNAKTLRISSTTDGSSTTPTSGEVGIEFLTLGQVKAKLSQDGYFGVNTTSPAQPLHVAGIARFERPGIPTQAIHVSPDVSQRITSYSDPANAKPLMINVSTDTSNTEPTGGSISLDLATMGVTKARLTQAGDMGVGPGALTPTTRLHVDGPIRHATYTVATLPSASAVGAGTIATVTDASNTPAAGNVVASGGTRTAMVESNGTAWIEGGVAPRKMRATAGTAADPSISFDGDANTGLFSASADQIGLSTGGTQRALLTSSLLNVNVQSHLQGRAFVTRPDVTSPVDENYVLQVQALGDSHIKIQAGATSSVYFGMGTTSDALNAGLSLSNVTGLLNIRAGNANRISVLSAGDVGIGTSSPTTKLHVDGPVRTKIYTVATLPSASAVGAGTRSAVTDANATTFNSVVAGGGANFVPVISDGTNWRIG